MASELEELLESLHDVIFFEHRHPDSSELELRKSEAFQKSVLKSTSALEAYGAGKQILFSRELLPNRFDFAVSLLLKSQKEPIVQSFVFDSKSGLPANIFVLIGRNGLGKTQLLYAVQRFLTDEPLTGAILYPRLRDDSTIFDNVLQQRPYEDWLDGLLQKGVSLEELRKRFGEILNLESFIYLRGKMAKKGKDGEAESNNVR